MRSPVLIFILIFLLFTGSLYSQPNKRTNFWYFGHYAGIDFNSGEPQPDINGHVFEAMGNGSAVISDTNGNLLFYTDGRDVWRKNHNWMHNGANNYNPGTQSAVIIPKPGSDHIYYLFAASHFYYQSPFYYLTIDMNLANGFGEVIAVDTIQSCWDAADKLTAVYHKNKHDIWVITRKFVDDNFAAFLVTEYGVNPEPVLSPAPDINVHLSGEGGGYMKVSYDKKYLVSCFNWSTGANADDIEICTFNSATGMIEYHYSFRLRHTIIPYAPYRVLSFEFSPDSKYLYFPALVVNDSICYILQYDMEHVMDSSLFINSYVEVGSGQGISAQLAPDGKIYFSSNHWEPTLYLGVIHKPWLRGTECDYEADAVYLEGRKVERCLPNFMTDYLFRFDYEGICESDTFYFDPWFFPDPTYIVWNFGDPASGSNNTSTIPHATHVFSDGGTYEVSVHVEYPSGRIEETSRKLEVEYAPEPDLGPDTTICSGEEVILNAECGPHFYSWSTGQFGISQVTVSDSGWHWVRVTSSAGCFEFDSIHIAFYPPAIADTSNLEIIPTTCGGSMGIIRGLTVSGNPPFVYQWIDDLGNPIANTIDIYHLPVGNYTLQVTDSNNCLNEFGPYTIHDAGDVLIKDVEYASEHCDQQNGSIIITATSGLSDMLFYSIDNGANYYTNQGIFTGLSAGSYAVRVKDSSDCQDVFINNPVIIKNIPGPQIVNVVVTSCVTGQNNGAIEITASGGSDTLFYSNDNGMSFQINNGGFYNLAPGFYTCVVMDEFGCDTTFTVEVPEEVTIRLQAVAGDDEVCPGNTAFVPLFVSNFNDVAHFKTTLLYNKDLLTCSGFANAHLQLADSLVALLFPAEGRIELNWSSTAITLPDNTPMADLVFQSIDPGMSLIEWDGSAGASSFQNSTGLTIPVDYFTGDVKIYKEVDLSLISTNETCQGETLELSPIVWSSNGDVTYLWTDPNGDTSSVVILTINNIQPNQSGTYSLMVTDTVDCQAEASVDVLIYQTPVPAFAGQDTIITEDPVEIDAGANYASYLWNTGETGQHIIASYDGWYGVIIESLQGCMGEDSVYVLFEEPPLPPEPVNENIYIPNAFSPNGDGLNDEFKVTGNSEIISSFRMHIYNRWGNLVFGSNDISTGWDGQYKGKPVLQGAYVYKIEYSISNPIRQESQIKSGTLMLVR